MVPEGRDVGWYVQVLGVLVIYDRIDEHGASAAPGLLAPSGPIVAVRLVLDTREPVTPRSSSTTSSKDDIDLTERATYTAHASLGARGLYSYIYRLINRSV